MSEMIEIEEAPEGGRSKTTMGELGATLPLGTKDLNGVLQRSIVTKPWRLKEEKELGALRDRYKDANVAQYVSMVLGTMCTRLGHHDFTAMKPEERRIHIGQMWMGDVFYAYCYLRRDALGSDLATRVACPHCGHKFQLHANLDTLEVHTGDSIEAFQQTYKLRHPFTIRGKPVESLVLGPARWNALEGITGRINTGTAKAALIRGSIHAIPGHEGVVLAPHELDELSKRDLEAITGLLDANVMGPDMAISGECPRCSESFRTSIDWGYDGFFGISSQ